MTSTSTARERNAAEPQVESIAKAGRSTARALARKTLCTLFLAASHGARLQVPTSTGPMALVDGTRVAV